MISHGTAPFIECSSKGDSRFSAFYARVRARGNRSIEDLYQGTKVFEDGRTNLGWREAKGKRAVNMKEVTALYAQLWDEFVGENPGLLKVLTAASGLSDKFGQPGHCCQATELWRIRCAALSLSSERRVESGSPESPERAVSPRGPALGDNFSLFDSNYLADLTPVTTERKPQP